MAKPSATLLVLALLAMAFLNAIEAARRENQHQLPKKDDDKLYGDEKFLVPIVVPLPFPPFFDIIWVPHLLKQEDIFNQANHHYGLTKDHHDLIKGQYDLTKGHNQAAGSAPTSP